MSLKVAIVGMGNIGNIHGRVYAAHPDTEIVAVCDIIPERSDKAAEKFGCQGFYSVRDMLNSGLQFDMVSMATAGVENGGDHYAPTMELLRAGIPVLGEKPISNDLKLAREMAVVAAAGRRHDQHASHGAGQREKLVERLARYLAFAAQQQAAVDACRIDARRPTLLGPRDRRQKDQQHGHSDGGMAANSTHGEIGRAHV